MIRVLAACAALLLLPACVSAPKSYSFKKSWSIGTDFDSAWTATVQLFAENNWPVATLEKDSGIIASEWVTIPHKNDACDCGSAGLLVTVHRTEAKFNVFLRNTDDGCSLTVNASYRQLRQFEAQTWWQECSSTGELEGRVKEEILLRAE